MQEGVIKILHTALLPNKPCTIGSRPELSIGWLLLKDSCTVSGPSLDREKSEFTLSKRLRTKV